MSGHLLKIMMQISTYKTVFSQENANSSKVHQQQIISNHLFMFQALSLFGSSPSVSMQNQYDLKYIHSTLYKLTFKPSDRILLMERFCSDRPFLLDNYLTAPYSRKQLSVIKKSTSRL